MSLNDKKTIIENSITFNSWTSIEDENLLPTPINRWKYTYEKGSDLLVMYISRDCVSFNITKDTKYQEMIFINSEYDEYQKIIDYFNS